MSLFYFIFFLIISPGNYYLSILVFLFLFYVFFYEFAFRKLINVIDYHVEKASCCFIFFFPIIYLPKIPVRQRLKVSGSGGYYYYVVFSGCGVARCLPNVFSFCLSKGKRFREKCLPTGSQECSARTAAAVYW